MIFLFFYSEVETGFRCFPNVEELKVGNLTCLMWMLRSSGVVHVMTAHLSAW